MEFLRNIKVHLKYQVSKTLFWPNIRRRYPYINKVPKRTINYIREDNDRCTELFGMVDKQMESDAEPYHKRGRQLLNAYQDGNPDLILMAVTGYTLKGLIEKCNFQYPTPITKEDYIAAIKKIISDYGCFGVGEIEAESSVCINNHDGIIELAELFNEKVVTVQKYEEKTNSYLSCYYITYENLELHILMEIYKLALDWKAYNED